MQKATKIKKQEKEQEARKRAQITIPNAGVEVVGEADRRGSAAEGICCNGSSAGGEVYYDIRAACTK